MEPYPQEYIRRYLLISMELSRYPIFIRALRCRIAHPAVSCQEVFPLFLKEIGSDGTAKPEQWCQLMISICYIAVGINAAVLIAVWYFFVFPVQETSHILYWGKYIVGPSLFMLAVSALTDRFVRSRRFPLLYKEYAVISLILFFCTFLCFVHGIAAVLLATFVLPVFASSLFANLKMTKRIFILSQIALVLSAIRMHFFTSRIYEHWIWYEALTASGILLAAYLLTRVFIRYGQYNISSLIDSYNSQKSLREQLKRDPFTGLYNRKTYEEFLPKLMSECKASNTCLSLAVLDLDNFKEINDTYGHAAGDKVLLRLAHILMSNQNANILAFRLGGEEFALLLKEYCVHDAYKVCEGIRSIMESSSVPDVSNKRVTFSCGLMCMNEQYADPGSFFKAADYALYQAKNSGKNRTMFYDKPTECIKTQGAKKVSAEG